MKTLLFYIAYIMSLRSLKSLIHIEKIINNKIRLFFIILQIQDQCEVSCPRANNSHARKQKQIHDDNCYRCFYALFPRDDYIALFLNNF